MDDENNAPSPTTMPPPRRWRDRYRWLGVLMIAAFAGIGPAPPPPKPPRDLAEYAQIAEDPDGLKLDPELYFLHKQVNADETHLDA